MNLGFAHHALHRWTESVRSFEEAQERYGAALSVEAQTALAQARAASGVKEQVVAAAPALIDGSDSAVEEPTTLGGQETSGDSAPAISGDAPTVDSGVETAGFSSSR